MLTTFINTLMSAEADAVCGAAYGESSPDQRAQRPPDHRKDHASTVKHHTRGLDPDPGREGLAVPASAIRLLRRQPDISDDRRY
jgi:hypothetical protein